MITIRADIAIATVGDLLRVPVGHTIPDGLALATLIPTTLDLVRGRANAEAKVRREAPRILTAHSAATRHQEEHR